MRSQDIAIPSINVTSDSGIPVLTFYVQLPSGNVLFSLVLTTAVQASFFFIRSTSVSTVEAATKEVAPAKKKTSFETLGVFLKVCVVGKVAIIIVSMNYFRKLQKSSLKLDSLQLVNHTTVMVCINNLLVFTILSV